MNEAVLIFSGRIKVLLRQFVLPPLPTDHRGSAL